MKRWRWRGLPELSAWYSGTWDSPWGCVSYCFRDFIALYFVHFSFLSGSEVVCRLGIRVHVCVRKRDFPRASSVNWGLGPTQPTSSHRGGTFVVLWWNFLPKKKTFDVRLERLKGVRFVLLFEVPCGRKAFPGTKALPSATVGYGGSVPGGVSASERSTLEAA